MNNKITRRQFFKWSGAAGIAVAGLGILDYLGMVHLGKDKGTAVILIDMYPSLYDDKPSELEAVCEVAKKAVESGAYIIDTNYDERMALSDISSCRENVHALGKVIPDDYPNYTFFPKPHFSAFYKTPLKDILKKNGIETIILTGSSDQCCVMRTAFDAACGNYDAWLSEDTVQGWAHPGFPTQAHHKGLTYEELVKAYAGNNQYFGTLPKKINVVKHFWQLPIFQVN